MTDRPARLVCAYRFEGSTGGPGLPCLAYEEHPVHHGAWTGPSKEPNHDFVPLERRKATTERRAAAHPPATVPEPLDHAPGCDVFRVGGGPRQCDCGFALWDAKRRGVYNWTPPARQHFDGDETCAACGFGKFAHECPVAPPATVPETWHEDWRDPGMDVYDAPPATVPDEGRYEYVPLLQEAMREAAELKVPGRVTVTYDDAWALWLALGKRHLGLISDEAFAALSATKAQEP